MGQRILSCSIRDRVLRLRIEPQLLALEVQGLSHWTTRAVPRLISCDKSTTLEHDVDGGEVALVWAGGI